MSEIRASNEDAERIHITDRTQWKRAEVKVEEEEKQKEKRMVYVGCPNICHWTCMLLHASVRFVGLIAYG